MRIAIIIAALALATSASAGTFTEKDQKVCEELSSLAQTMMTKRQEGVAMNTQMRIVKRLSTPNIRSVYQSMIAEAYNEPDWSSDRMREKSIRDFRDSWYRRCYEALSNGQGA